MSPARLWPAPYAEALARQEAADRQRIHARYQAAGNHGLAVRLAELSGSYPSLGGGPLLGAALAGLDVDDPRMADLAITSTQLDAEALDGLRASTLESVGNNGGSIWSLPFDLFKGAARTTFLGFDFLWEEVLMRPLRTVVGVSQDMTWADAYGAAGASTALRALQTALRDPWGSFTPRESRPDAEVNVGSGFFQASTLSEATQRALATGMNIDQASQNPEQAALGVPLTQITRQQRETGIQITSPGGVKVPISPGRLLAINFVEPGTTAFNIASGIGDVSAQIFLDPSNLALGWLSKVTRGMNTVLAPGMLAGAERKVLAPRTLSEGLAMPAGRNFLDQLARNDVSFETTLGMLKPAQKFTDPQVAIDVYNAARTGNPDVIRDAFLKHEPRFVGGQQPFRQSMLGRRFNTRSGTLLGAPVSSTIGRYGAPAIVQGGVGAAAGAFTAALTGQDPKTGAMVGGAAGLGLGMGVTRLPGGGDLGAFIGKTQTLGLAVHHNSRQADTYLAWLATSVGAHGYSIRDKAQTLQDFADNTMLMRLDAPTRDELLIRMAKAEGMPEVYGVVRDSYAKWADQLVASGEIPREVADQIVRLYKKDWTDFRAYWVDKAEKHHYAPGASLTADINGKPITNPSAFLMSELVDQWVPILDPKVVRAALRRTNRHSIISKSAFTDWDRLGDRVLTRWADTFMTKVWKPLVLLRVAWPVRVITEEQIRMAMMGMNSTFRHPIQYLAQMLAGSDAKTVDRLMGAGRTRARDAEGELMRLADESAAMRSSRTDWIGGIDVRDPHSGEFGLARWGTPAHTAGHVNQVGLLTKDPIAAAVADAAARWQAAGHSLAGEPGWLADVKAQLVDGMLADNRWQMAHDGGRHSIMRERGAVEDHVDYVWGRIVEAGGAEAYYRRAYGVFPNKEAATIPGTGEVTGLPGPGGQIIDPGSGWVSTRGEPVPMNLVDAARGRPGRTVYRAPEYEEAGRARTTTLIHSTADGAEPSFHESLHPSFNEPLRQIDQAVSDALDAGAAPPAIFDDMAEEIVRLADDLGVRTDLVERDLRFLREYINEGEREGASETWDELLQHLTSRAEYGAPRTISPGGAERSVEDFIPQMEARRLARFTDDEFANTWSAMEEYHAFTPVEITGLKVADGFYRVPASSTWGAGGRSLTNVDTSMVSRGPTAVGDYGMVVIVRDNHVAGELTYAIGRDRAGQRTITHVASIRTAPTGHPLGRNSDGPKLLDEMLAGEELPPEGLLGLVLGSGPGDPFTVGEWLRGQNVADVNMAKAATTEGLFDEIRRVMDGKIAGLEMPMGAETLSRQGARYTGSRIRRATRGGAGKLDVANWPQVSPAMVIPPGMAEPTPELLELIAHDRWRYTDAEGTSIIREGMFRDGPDGARPYMAQEVRDHSARKAEFGRQYTSHLDEKMVDPTGRRLFRETVVSAPVRQGADQVGTWDKAIDFLFDVLMGKRTDVLSRSPAFNQFYWKRMARLIPMLEPADARKALDQLRAMNPRTFTEWAGDLLKGDDGTLSILNRMADNNIDHATFLRNLDGMPEGTARLALDEADEIAKAFALTEVRDLLYDISRKHNVFDLTRHIFPFGEAWLEIITRWGNIIRENPRVLRRLDQTISAARDTGFFYNDDSTGEEVFAYPGSGLISKWMFGDPNAVRFTGRVGGLNLMLGQFMPGFGPVVQIPAQQLARDFLEHPDNKFLRELLVPFGFQDADTPGDLVDTLLPTWVRRLAVAWERPTGDDQRIFNNTVIDVLRVMVETGEADIGTQAGWDAAYAAATSKAKILYAIRAASALMGPTPASPRFYQEDTNGRLWSFTALSDEYHALLEDNQGSEYLATQQFSQLFGLDPSLYTTPKTRSLVRRSTSEPGAAFEARNPELFNLYPTTAYYSRPDDIEEEFDYNAYVRQLRGRTGSGEDATRQALDPRQWAEERNEFLGRMAYHHARVMMGDQRTTAAGKTKLAEYRALLMERYKGYNSPILGIEQRTNREAVIREFLTWESSPALMATDAGQGLALYTAARQQAIDQLMRMGLSASSLGSSQKGAIYRDWLRAISLQIIALHPSFLTQWTEVWSHEIEETDLDAERQQIIDGVGF